MESNTVLILIALTYGLFLGYCLGRAHGYSQGAKMARAIFTDSVNKRLTRNTK